MNVFAQNIYPVLMQHKGPNMRSRQTVFAKLAVAVVKTKNIYICRKKLLKRAFQLACKLVQFLAVMIG